jgi:hypothetical protein
MKNTKLGLNGEKFKFTPKCKDKIQFLGYLTSMDGKIELSHGYDNHYKLVSSNPNDYMEYEIYKDMEFINQSARVRKLTENNGTKESEGKLNYELDFDFITQMAEKMSLNKSKYEPYNWKKPINIELLKQSLFRHVVEIMKGNYKDLESAALNCMMINYQLKQNENTSK